MCWKQGEKTATIYLSSGAQSAGCGTVGSPPPRHAASPRPAFAFEAVGHGLTGPHRGTRVELALVPSVHVAFHFATALRSSLHVLVLRLRLRAAACGRLVDDAVRVSDDHCIMEFPLGFRHQSVQVLKGQGRFGVAEAS